MCLAIPSKIIKIKAGWATVRSENPASAKATAGKHTHRANLSLVKGAKIGDYVLVHADMALNKIDGSEAKKILKIIKELVPSKTKQGREI